MMYNPPHPGEILKEQLGRLSVSQAAAHLRIARATLSRILNGRAGVSAEMSLRLSEAFGTSPDLWLKLQTNYDLWRASQKRRKKIPRIKQTAA